jgi:hypothetical protein
VEGGAVEEASSFDALIRKLWPIILQLIDLAGKFYLIK